MFDKDGSGKIEANEIRKVISGFDASISDKEIDELISELDKNNDGLIDFSEFANQFGKKYYTCHPKAELEAAFKYFELAFCYLFFIHLSSCHLKLLFNSKDNSGYIDENELFQVVQQFNQSLSRDHIKKMISKIDKDNSGKVSIDGNINLWKFKLQKFE